MFGSIQCSHFSIFFFWPNQIHKIYSCFNQCHGCVFYKKFLVIIFRNWNSVSYIELYYCWPWSQKAPDWETVEETCPASSLRTCRAGTCRTLPLGLSSCCRLRSHNQNPEEREDWLSSRREGATFEDVLSTLWWVITLPGPDLTPSLTVTREE